MKPYFRFIQNPEPPNISAQFISVTTKLLTVLKIYLFTLLLAAIAATITGLFDKILVSFFSIKSLTTTHASNFKAVADRFGNFKVFYVALFVPALEELIFRLPLQAKPFFISFSFGMLLYPIAGFSYIHFDVYALRPYLGVVVFLILIPVVVGWVLKKINITGIINKNYRVYFYILSSLFALVHISNFKPLNYNLIYLYPLYVLPQFVMGVSLGYLRNKCGLQYSLLLHSLINLPRGIF